MPDDGLTVDDKVRDIVRYFKKHYSPAAVAGMLRFGIRTSRAYGLSIPALRTLAKKFGTDHELASALWSTQIHDARLLATFVGDPRRLTPEQMESWVKDFDSWDVCDQCCSNLFDRTPYVQTMARKWSARKNEFVRRAGYVLMATSAVHDKEGSDAVFLRYFPAIRRGASDERNFVRKAVNWALRQIGKRNKALNKSAIRLAHALRKSQSPSARWVAGDALRELKSSTVQKRLRDKDGQKGKRRRGVK